MSDKAQLCRLIDEVEHRIETSSKHFRDTDRWIDEDYLDVGSFLGTYQEWIDQAFADLRGAVMSLKEGQADD